MKINVTDEQVIILTNFFTGSLAEAISLPIARMDAVMNLKEQLSDLAKDESNEEHERQPSKGKAGNRRTTKGSSKG